MNVTPLPRVVTAVTVAWLTVAPASLAAQQPGPVTRLVAQPVSLTIQAGQTAKLQVTAYDAQGRIVPDARIRISAPRAALRIRDGEVVPLRAGTREVVAAVFQLADAAPFTLTIPVTVTWPPLAKLEVVPEPGRLYTGVTLGHQVKAFHADGSERTEVQVSWTGSNPRVATVDRYGNVTAVRPGNLTVTAVAEGVKGERLHTVVANPVQGLSIDISQASQQRAVVRQAGAQGPGAVKARAWANRSTRRVPCCGTT